MLANVTGSCICIYSNDHVIERFTLTIAVQSCLYIIIIVSMLCVCIFSDM